MAAPPNSSFWLFEQGVFTKTQVLEAEGRVNVTVDRDTLRQLADLPFFYDKARTQNVSADTHKDSVAFSATLQTRMALTAIGRAYKNDTGSNISYNDISLPKGGLFDWLAVHPLGGTDKPWATPHSSHRRGTDVDVNKPGGAPCTQNTSVQKAVDSILVGTGSNKTALVCETSNFGNYHIIVDQLKIPQAFHTIFIF